MRRKHWIVCDDSDGEQTERGVPALRPRRGGRSPVTVSSVNFSPMNHRHVMPATTCG